MRNEDLERAFLRDVCERAGLTGDDAARFREMVGGRMDKGSEEYGDSAFMARSFLELIHEAGEEATDGAGGWLNLALQRLGHEVSEGYPAEAEELLRIHALDAAAKFVAAWQVLQEMAEVYAEYRPEPVVIGGPPESHPWAVQDDSLGGDFE